MRKFFEGNEWYWRLARTVVQGVIGVLIANLDVIFTYIAIDEGLKPVIVALVMAILSPCMASLANKDRNGETP